MKRDPCKNKVKPDFVKDRRRFKREYDAFHTGTLVALRKKRGGLKNSFCRVKNEKGFVRIVVMKKIVKRKRVRFALNH